MTKKKKIELYSLFTIFFAIIAGYIFFTYYSNNMSLIHYGGDGYRQHYKALLYYSDYLKNIISTIIKEGKIIIPQYDFSIGEGSDILQTLHYYAIGDPINLLSILCPREYLYIFYDVGIFLRLYIAGLVFINLCIYLKKTNILILLSGALSYSFCFFAINSIREQIFFLNVLIYFPLVILGINKLLKDDSPITLSIAVFFSAISNFYFFYMIVLSTIIYTFVKIAFLQTTIENKIKTLLKVFIYSFAGFAMSSFISLPMLDALLSNSRLGVEYGFYLFYPIDFYKNIISNFFVNECLDNYGGYTVTSFIALLYLLMSKKNKETKFLVCLSFVFMVIPLFSKVYNGMSYMNCTRWYFVICLLYNYIFVDVFNDRVNFKKYCVYILLIILLLIIVSIIIDDRTRIHILILLMSVVVLFSSILLKNNNIFNLEISLITIFCVFLNVYILFSPTFWNYSRNGTPIYVLKENNENEMQYINSIKDEDFWRYSGNNLTTNLSMINNKYSTQFYWSIANSDVVKFRTNLGMLDANSFHYDNYDNRFALYSLSSTKYYINDGLDIPYGFTGDNTMYINNNCLPLIYGYKNVTNYNDWLNLDLIKRQESLLQSAVIEDNETIDDTVFYDEEIEYKFKDSVYISVDKNNINILNNNEKLIIEANEKEYNGEIYLIFNNLKWGNPEKNMYEDRSTKIHISSLENNLIELKYKNKNHERYSNRHDFVVCLGNVENDSINDIEIIFSNEGKYSFDSIKLICLSSMKQKEMIKNLNCVRINDLSIFPNKLKAHINVDDDKLLCFSIPYLKGWKAKVDGKEVDIKKINVMYMGFEVEKGNHNVELYYGTPFLKLGLFTSFVSFLFVVIQKYRLSKV